MYCSKRKIIKGSARVQEAVIALMLLGTMSATTPAAEIATTPGQTGPYVQEWKFENPGAQWIPKGTDTVTMENGVEKIHSTGPDPEILSPERSPDLALNLMGRTVTLQFRMKSNSSGIGRVLWSGGVWYAGPQYHNFNSGQPSTFIVHHDGQWHDYEVEIPAMGRLDYIRLSPSSAPGEIELAWIKMNVSPTPQPSIPVSIHGTLVDDHGVPINEGFLMLKGNPQLNALSDGDGNFHIDGNAWELPDVLLASWSGYEVARLKIDRPSNKDLKIQLQPQDSEFTKIEMGMSLTLRWFPPYLSSRPLTDGQRQCLKSYKDFLASRGEGIIAKMLVGTPLTDDEARYEYVLAAEIGNRTSNPSLTAEVNYSNQVKSGFYRTSLQAIRRHRLSESDVHALRLMTANFAWTGFLATSNDYYSKMGTFFPPVTLGETLPFDIPLLRTSPLHKAPGWSDYTSLSATTYLRLEGLWTLLDSYWKWQIRDDGSLVQTPMEDWKKKYWQPWYEVTSVNDLAKQGKGKPQFLDCQNYEDGTGFGFTSLEAEYLRRAYRGQVDVYQVSQATDTAWVDIFADEWTYFGSNPHAEPLLGRDNPRWEDKNYTPFRHARMDKLCNMGTPFPSGEILLDGTTRFGSFLANKVALDSDVILDRDGKVATPFPGGDFMSISCRFFPSYAVHTSYERMGGQTFWYGLIFEQILRGLVANGGKWSPGVLDHAHVQYPPLFHLKDDVFVVKSIDKQKGLIHAGWFDPGKARFVYPDGCGHPVLDGVTSQGDFLFKVKTGTRFVVRFNAGSSAWLPWGAEGEPSHCVYKLMGLDDFKPGDRFFATVRLPELQSDATVSSLLPRYVEPYTSDEEVKKEKRLPAFDMSKYEGKELDTERIMNYCHSIIYSGTSQRFMPLFGRIIQKEGPLITVRISPDEVKEMSGYRFGKEEELKGRQRDHLTSSYWPILKRWADGTDSDRTYRFNIDGATDVYRNGLFAASMDLAVGDNVFIEYERWWESQQMQKEIIFPERIQASAPVQSADLPRSPGTAPQAP